MLVGRGRELCSAVRYGTLRYGIYRMHSRYSMYSMYSIHRMYSMYNQSVQSVQYAQYVTYVQYVPSTVRTVCTVCTPSTYHLVHSMHPDASVCNHLHRSHIRMHPYASIRFHYASRFRDPTPLFAEIFQQTQTHRVDLAKFELRFA